MIEEPRSELTGKEIPDVLLSQFISFERPDVRTEELTTFDTAPTLRKGAFREWVESLAFTILFVLVFTSYIAQATQVPTESMKPTILVGDHFFLDKLAFPANYPAVIRTVLPHRSIKRLDIIAFKSPTDGNIPFVKRVIGLPGETVSVRGKSVYINDRKLDEPYKIHVDSTTYSEDPWTPEELKVPTTMGPPLSRQEVTSSWATTVITATTAGTGDSSNGKRLSASPFLCIGRTRATLMCPAIRLCANGSRVMPRSQYTSLIGPAGSALAQWWNENAHY